MKCPDCKEDMGDPIDGVYSKIKTKRVMAGQRIGDIYTCPSCGERWLADLLLGEVVPMRRFYCWLFGHRWRYFFTLRKKGMLYL